jgi:hypothetical protein
MSVTNEQIVQACTGLLGKVEMRKRRGGKPERVFLIAYQIWLLLQEEGNRICQILEDEYGTAVGKGGGANVGPAQRIGVALESSDQIETYHLAVRHLSLPGIEPSGSSCGLFRLREGD